MITLLCDNECEKYEHIIEFLQVIIDDHLNGNYNMNLVISDDEEITLLNEGYRGKEGPTDVLSFCQLESEDFPQPEDCRIELGDVILSIERAEEQARENGISVEEETARLTIHGTLHVLGYDHEGSEEEAEEMFLLQDEYLERYMADYSA